MAIENNPSLLPSGFSSQQNQFWINRLQFHRIIYNIIESIGQSLPEVAHCRCTLEVSFQPKCHQKPSQASTVAGCLARQGAGDEHSCHRGLGECHRLGFEQIVFSSIPWVCLKMFEMDVSIFPLYFPTIFSHYINHHFWG